MTATLPSGVPVKVEVAGPDSGDGMTSVGLPAFFTADARPARARAGGLGGMTVPSRMIRPMWSGESSTPWTGVSNYKVWIERLGSIRSEDRTRAASGRCTCQANGKGLAVSAQLPRSRHAHG